MSLDNTNQKLRSEIVLGILIGKEKGEILVLHDNNNKHQIVKVPEARVKKGETFQDALIRKVKKTNWDKAGI